MPDGRTYQVGDYWLAALANGYYYIHWYDKKTGRTKRKSSGTRDLQTAIAEITAHHLRELNPANTDSTSVNQLMLLYWGEKARHLASQDASRKAYANLAEFLAQRRDGDMLAGDWTRKDTADFVSWLHETTNNTDNYINRQLACIRSAFNYGMDRPPKLHLIEGVQAREGRKKPTLSKKQVADLFEYAFSESAPKHLKHYLIAAFTTLARPEAILDINVTPDRGQVEWDFRLLHLNPQDRKQQPNKYRPSVPINDILAPWLIDAETNSISGFLVEYRGKPLVKMRSTWNRAKEALGWPVGSNPLARDWDAKMIRHTMAKHLRASGVPWADVQGILGHSMTGITETYAEYSPDYLGPAQRSITAYFDDVFKGRKALYAQITRKSENKVITLNQQNPR